MQHMNGRKILVFQQITQNLPKPRSTLYLKTTLNRKIFVVENQDLKEAVQQ